MSRITLSLILLALAAGATAQSSLSSQELAEVLNWLLRDLSPAEVAKSIAPVNAAEVERYCRIPLLDVQDARAKLLR